MTIGDGRRAEGGVGEDVAVDLEGDVDAGSVAMGVDENVVGDDIRDDGALDEEEMEEVNCVLEATVAVHGGHDGVAGEDGGAGAGVDSLAGGCRGEVEVAGADEGLDTVVEVETGSDEGGGGVREAGGVRVRRRAGIAGIAAEGVERWLDAESSLASAALRRCLFGGGESEGAEGKERARVAVVKEWEGLGGGGCGNGAVERIWSPEALEDDPS